MVPGTQHVYPQGLQPESQQHEGTRITNHQPDGQAASPTVQEPRHLESASKSFAFGMSEGEEKDPGLVYLRD